MREFRLEDTEEYTANNMYIEDLDAVTNYTIEYRVTNNEDLVDVVTFAVTTGELGNLW